MNNIINSSGAYDINAYNSTSNNATISSTLNVSPWPSWPPWPSWQGESGVQSFDLDGVGSIPAISPTQFTCFIDEFNKLA